MKNFRKAFSLTELLVAMAIIAVLIAIAAFGIRILQRNARNTQRRKKNADIEMMIQDIYSQKQQKPGWIEYDPTSKSLIFKDTQSSLVINAQYPFATSFKEIHVETTTSCSPDKDVAGYGKPETKPSRLWLCYNLQNFDHGIRLEDGSADVNSILSLKKPLQDVLGKVNYNQSWTRNELSKIEHLNDGDPNTYLAVQTSGRTQATIDLEKSQKISQVQYQIFWDKNPSFKQQANIVFYTSQDKVSWTKHTVQTVENTNTMTSYSVPSGTEARYVKFEWANPPGGGWNGWGGIREITVE
jgi:prepilin-type N-terminal cleavage/methylation domain-containing protein